MSDGLMAGQPDGRLRLSGMIAIVLCLAAGPPECPDWLSLTQIGQIRNMGCWPARLRGP